MSSAEKPGAAVKLPEQPATKAIPENAPQKPDAKTAAAIPPASVETKKRMRQRILPTRSAAKTLHL